MAQPITSITFNSGIMTVLFANGQQDDWNLAYVVAPVSTVVAPVYAGTEQLATRSGSEAATAVFAYPDETQQRLFHADIRDIASPTYATAQELADEITANIPTGGGGGGGGTIVGVNATSPLAASGGTTRTITHEDAAVTAGVISVNGEPLFTVDAKGHIQLAQDINLTSDLIEDLSGLAPNVTQALVLLYDTILSLSFVNSVNGIGPGPIVLTGTDINGRSFFVVYGCGGVADADGIYVDNGNTTGGKPIYELLGGAPSDDFRWVAFEWRLTNSGGVIASSAEDVANPTLVTVWSGSADPLPRFSTLFGVTIQETLQQLAGALVPRQYQAKITQSGTGAPVATELFNNSGRTITWAYGSSGRYDYTGGGVDDAVSVNNQSVVSAGVGVIGTVVPQPGTLFTYDAVGVLADDILSGGAGPQIVTITFYN